MSRPEFEYDVEAFDNREADDKKVYVKFYIRPVLDETKSDEAGRPIYNEMDYVEIRTPGNATNIIQRPVTDMDKNRFRRQYAAYKAGEQEQLVGTPLVEVPWMSRSMVEELGYLRVRTLEQLAAIGDDVCTRIPGLFKMKQRAQVAVELGEKQAPLLALQSENEDLRNRLTAMEAASAEQAQLIAGLKAATKK